MLLLLPALALAAEPFPVALEQARRALVRHDDGSARKALADADTALGEATMLVPGEAVARVLYLRGVRAWAGGLQSQAMTEWRRMWHLGAWDPGDDGLLDDEGIAVLRALGAEGGGLDAHVDFNGDAAGVLVLADGARIADDVALYPGDHLLQVRCPDGAVTSAWVDVEDRYSLSLSCDRRGRKGAGVNEAVLAEDADEDLVHAALFGPYAADAALRLGQLPDEVSPDAAEATHPPPDEPKPAASPPPSATTAPRPVIATVQASTPDDPDDPLACPDATVFRGTPGGDGWGGKLQGNPVDGGMRVAQPGATWLAEAPDGDVSVRVEVEGDVGVRVRLAPSTVDGLAARLNPTGIDLVELPGTVVVGREVETAGRHVLRVDVRQDKVVVRLDDTMVLGGVTGEHREGTVGVEGSAGAWIGRVSVCR